jgi:hypothetical protein
MNPGAECPRDNADARAAGVGKSCLLLRFCDDGRNPPQAVTSTIGIDFNARTIEVDGQLIRLHMVCVTSIVLWLTPHLHVNLLYSGTPPARSGLGR